MNVRENTNGFFGENGVIKDVTASSIVPENGVDEVIVLPDYEMRLYGVYSTYFETQEELEDYCRSFGYSMDAAYVLDYLKSFAGLNDVIRATYPDGSTQFYTAVNEETYAFYSPSETTGDSEFPWECKCGNIRNICSAFQSRGIVFSSDVYAKYYERLRKKLGYEQSAVSNVVCTQG